MSQSNDTFSASAWQARLPEVIRREPKKMAVFAALVIVFGGMTLKTFVFTGAPAPASANSASSGRGEASTEDKTTSLASSEALRDAKAARAARADKLEAWLQGPLDSPRRNLFEFRSENYLSASHATAGVTDGAPNLAETGRFWDRLAKSITSRADLRRQRQIRTDNVVAVAGKLRLQSTMIQGGTPRAMIDGRMLKAGDVVAVDAPAANPAGAQAAKTTFRIERIGRQSVIVERDGVRIELSMTGTERVRVLPEEEQ